MQNSGMMYRPHYVSLPEAAPTASTALDDAPKPEEDASLTDATKESARQVTTTANTSIAAATSSATPVSTTGVGGAMGVASQQPVGSGNMNPPQASGTIRPPPSTNIPSQAAQQGQFTLNQGMQHRAPNAMMMRQGAMGRGMMGGAGGGAAAGMQVSMNRMMAAQQQGGSMPAMNARLRLEQIRAQNLQQQQQLRAGGGQYPAAAAAAAAGQMMGNHPPPNYRTPMMNPAAGGMPPGAPGGMMATHDMQQQMLLRHQQAQQRRMQMARLQQIQLQRRAAAMQQMAAGGYPAGAVQGQQYAMRPGPGGPMQANPPMPMGQIQYVQQQPPGMMPGGPRPPAQAPMGYQPGMNPGQPPMYR